MVYGINKDHSFVLSTKHMFRIYRVFQTFTLKRLTFLKTLTLLTFPESERYIFNHYKLK